MSVSVADVLKAAGAGADDTDLAQTCLAEAEQHVGDYITENLIDATKPVPEILEDAAVLTCASDVFARRKAPFGQQVMPDANGTLVSTRLGADPLGGVRPMLSGYCIAVTFAYPEETA